MVCAIKHFHNICSQQWNLPPRFCPTAREVEAEELKWRRMLRSLQDVDVETDDKKMKTFLCCDYITVMVLNEGKTCQPAKRNDSRDFSAPAINVIYWFVMMVLAVMKIVMVMTVTLPVIILSIPDHTWGLLCMPRAVLWHTSGPTSVL